MEAALLPVPLGVVRILANVGFLHLEREIGIQRGEDWDVHQIVGRGDPWGGTMRGQQSWLGCVGGVTLLSPLFSRAPLRSSLPTLLTPCLAGSLGGMGTAGSKILGEGR